VRKKDMTISDPISDFLTRLRNANQNNEEKVDVPASKICENMLKILKEEGYIRNYRRIDNRPRDILRVFLKYGPNKEKVINKIERISKSSVRKYIGKDKIPRVMGGLGISILTTSSGVMTGKEAKKRGIGGEIICRVM
jgi:small subunit ribosomal protein S8